MVARDPDFSLLISPNMRSSRNDNVSWTVCVDRGDLYSPAVLDIWALPCSAQIGWRRLRCLQMLATFSANTASYNHLMDPAAGLLHLKSHSSDSRRGAWLVLRLKLQMAWLFWQWLLSCEQTVNSSCWHYSIYVLNHPCPLKSCRASQMSNLIYIFSLVTAVVSRVVLVYNFLTFLM
jgi:hypothetical protein